MEGVRYRGMRLSRRFPSSGEWRESDAVRAATRTRRPSVLWAGGFVVERAWRGVIELCSRRFRRQAGVRWEAVSYPGAGRCGGADIRVRVLLIPGRGSVGGQRGYPHMGVSMPHETAGAGTTRRTIFHTGNSVRDTREARSHGRTSFLLTTSLLFETLSLADPL